MEKIKFNDNGKVKRPRYHQGREKKPFSTYREQRGRHQEKNISQMEVNESVQMGGHEKRVGLPVSRQMRCIEKKGKPIPNQKKQ